MALETGTYLADLNPANPAGADPKAQGDDHIRLIKQVAQNSFAGFPGAVVVTGSEAQGATANDYVVTVSPAPAAYSTAMLVVFMATHANTGAATLAVNGLTAKTLKAVDASGLEAGDIESGAVVGAFYDGTSFFLITGNDRGARAGDSYTGTHDFTAATLEAATQTVGDNSTKVATTAYADTNFGRITGQNWTGAQAFTGATITVPTQTASDNTTKAASTAFVQQVAFAAALPNQGGNGGKFLSTDGSSAVWTNIANTSGAHSADYTLISTDRYKVMDLSGSHTLSLTAAATLGDGFIFYVRNAGTGVWTIDPNGSETIDGLTTIQVYPEEAYTVICDGSNWRCFGRAKRVKVFSQTIGSSVASVDIETPFADAELERFTLKLQGLNGSGAPSLRLKKGGAYLTSGYSGNLNYASAGTFGTLAWLSSAQISTNNTSYTGNVEILNPTQATPTVITGTGWNGDSTATGQVFSGSDGASTAAQGVRVFTSSGSLTAGVVELWADRF